MRFFSHLFGRKKKTAAINPTTSLLDSLSDNSYLFYISKDLPYYPLTKDIIYVEKEHSNLISQSISDMHKEIEEKYENAGFHFIYLPQIIKDYSKEEYFKYYNPQLKSDSIPDNAAGFTEKDLLSYVSSKTAVITHGLIRYTGEIKEENNSYIFEYQELDEINSNNNAIIDQLYAFLYLAKARTRDEVVRFQIISNDNDEPSKADKEFSYEARKIIKEIEERINKLQAMGIKEMVVKSLFNKTPQKLSRLVVTSDYNIILTDYNDMEIKLQPIQKAVYILFLKHPEGIIFKDLPNYKDELGNIYRNISNREHAEPILQSLDNAVDPTKNTINEICSKIRSSFLNAFDHSLSSHYYITGERSTPKLIRLDRKLVTLQF